jgi:hypothetical protein
MLPLRDLQRSFLATVAPAADGDGTEATGAGGAGEPVAARADPAEVEHPAAPIDPALLELVNGHGGMDAADRIAIYRGMYRARLADVLREDFPRVEAVVGEAAFSVLVRRYLARHPSTHPSVRQVGRRFAAFVADTAAGPSFLADLARLEWARVEAFDAPDADPLCLADLEGIPPAGWPAMRFRPIPSCLLVESDWPVHEVWAAAADPGCRGPWTCEPRATAIRVWREGWSVSHAVLGAVERRAFPLLQRGAPFARLCAALGDDLDPGAAAREVGSLLMRWLEDGLLARRPAPDPDGGAG